MPAKAKRLVYMAAIPISLAATLYFASGATVLLLIAAIAFIGIILSWQLTQLTGSIDEMRGRISSGAKEVRDWISQTIGISADEQNKMIEEQKNHACGILEIIPFVGNLVGNLIVIFAALIQGGDVRMVVGIIAVYLTVQLLQTYVLEPLVVGQRVTINPLFTIMGLVAGGVPLGRCRDGISYPGNRHHEDYLR